MECICWVFTPQLVPAQKHAHVSDNLDHKGDVEMSGLPSSPLAIWLARFSVLGRPPQQTVKHKA